MGIKDIDKQIREAFQEEYDLESLLKEAEKLEYNLPEWSEIKAKADELDRFQEVESQMSEEKKKKTPRARRMYRNTKIFVVAILLTLSMAVLTNGSRLYNFIVQDKQVAKQSEIQIATNKNGAELENDIIEAIDDIYDKTGVKSFIPMNVSIPFSKYQINGNNSYIYYQEKEKKIVVIQSRKDYDSMYITSSDKEIFKIIESNNIPELSYEVYEEIMSDDTISYSTIFVYENIIYHVFTVGVSEEEFEDFIKNAYIKTKVK